jgi:ADP-ribosylglycohydrolase
MRTLPQDYAERAYAAVLGKLIGVYLGRPFEGWTYQRIIDELGPIGNYVHERLACPLVVTDDDVAGTFTFIRALEDHGARPDISSREIGKTWLNYIVENRAILWWGGNGNSTEHTAWLNLKRGIEAPESGSIAVNGQAVAEQIGAQIFIDGWAIVAPGNPSLAARLAEQAAKVSHDGTAVDAAKLWAAMEAEAFVSRDVERLIDIGLEHIPASSPIAKLVADIRQWRRQYSDWRDTRQAIEARYGYDKYPGNCHVVPNHALMIMTLLYEPADFSRAQTIVCTSGWDTDCNAGNVGCLMGAMLGLGGIEAGRDWRGPIADRMLISSADGGGAINDAVRISARLVDLGRKLAGQQPQIAPKDGAQFHFSPPGSVQGFMPTGDGAARPVIRNVPHGTGRALRVRYAGLGTEPAAVLTPTFAPPEVARMRTYELMATPLVYPGEIVRARVVADTLNANPVSVGLRALVYGANDALSPLDSAPVVLSPGMETVLTWRLPDTGGEPIQSIGLVFHSDGATTDGEILLDYLRWDGPPNVELRRPDAPGEFWRRAWVNAVGVFSTNFPQAFRISQDRGEGMIIHGGRRWTDHRVETALTVHLAEYAGVGVRVQGLRRYYAVLLVRPDRLRLVRVVDEAVNVLAESAFAWTFETPYAFVVQVSGATIEASVNGIQLKALDESPLALANGGVALILQGGACSCDAIHVGPPRGAPDLLGVAVRRPSGPDFGELSWLASGSRTSTSPSARSRSSETWTSRPRMASLSFSSVPRVAGNRRCYE